MAVATTRFSTPMLSAQAPRSARPGPVPCAAEAVFAGAKALLSSGEARQMSISDLERELHRRHQELVRKLLQEHRGQRSPRKTAGPVNGDGIFVCSGRPYPAGRAADEQSHTGASGVGCPERREYERHSASKTPCRTLHVPRPGYAPRGHDAALHLPPARYGVEVRRRTTIATPLRAPPRTPLQFTALDISHAGGLVRAASGVRPPSVAGAIGRGLSASLRELPFSHRRNGPELVDGPSTAALR